MDNEDIEFTGKIIEGRATPSPAFQSALKQRLLTKLSEMEDVAASTKAPSVRGWFSRVFSQPTWQAAGAVAVLLIAILVGWRAGLFAPGPVVTSPYPTVAVDANASLGRESYLFGESMSIDFSFKNVSSETLVFSFPPAFTIETLDGRSVRAFAVGTSTRSLAPGESANSSVTWDQKGDNGVQVPAGEYQIVMPNVKLGESGYLSLTRAPVLAISPP
jgi:hypothetical protein